MQHKKPFFITGGKTGGHIYPAISVARELAARGNKIFYVGNDKNLEYKIAKSEGFDFLSIDVDGMPRKFSLRFIGWAFKMFIGTLAAIRYILKYKPSVIFATGGFVCAPSLLAASLLKVPYVLHDCDAHPGLVTRVFAKKAASVSVAFRDARGHIGCRNTFFRGNPIREDFFKLTKEQAREELGLPCKTTILIMGGSQGAKSINESAVSVINHFKGNDNIQIILQTGDKNYADVMSKLGEVPPNVLIKPYFENMILPLLAADIAVSRAGSLSISELCASGLPSILVPYPYSAADHQKFNAKKMEEIGAALYLEDEDLSTEKLTGMIEDIIYNPNKLATMCSCASAEARPNAAKEIAEQIIEASQG